MTNLRNTPSGDADVVSFELWGHRFMAISAGPLFKFNPSVSFVVNFGPSSPGDTAAREKLDEAWAKLSEGGTALIPIGEYPFSKRYGWVQDRYGLSWQLILSNPQGDPRPTIVPSLMFAGDNCGKAEEAIDFYTSAFKRSRKGNLHRYGAGHKPDREDSVMHAEFALEGGWFAAMDSARSRDLAFNEAVSLMVQCDDQDEIDHYWKRLSAVPKAEQCGWLKDRYGLSWQITPRDMSRMMREGTPDQIARVTQAFLKMKKFDLATLQRAYDGK